MTWLRFDTDAAQSDVVGHLAEALGIPAPHAFGCYVACCLAFGAHQPDGRTDQITDTTLELWALWTGRRGRFAAAFRARCVDESGVVRGWWRQDALLRHQEAKCRRPNAKTRAARQKTGTNPAPDFSGNVTVRYDNVVTTSSTPAATQYPTTDVGLPADYQADLDALLRSAGHPEVVLTALRSLCHGRHPQLERVTPQDVGEGLRALLLDRAPAAKLARYVQTAHRIRTEPFDAPKPRQRSQDRPGRPNGADPSPAYHRKYRDPYTAPQATEPLAAVLARVAPTTPEAA